MTARSKKAAQPKDNAKGRRKKENKELSDLASQLPLPFNAASQLDKASVIRLATAYLKLRRLFPHGLGKEWGEDSSVAVDMLPEMGKFLNKAFHGFVFILGADATILYISEEASAQLGFSQVQLTGKSFWSYLHTNDAKELKSFLCFDVDIPAFNIGNPIAEDIEIPRSFTVRMKCILPKRQSELAVDRYKVIHCRGYLQLKRKSKPGEGLSSVFYEMTGVVASGHSLSPTPSAEVKLHEGDFMFRTGLNLKFSYMDPRSKKIIGYEPTQLQDKSLYRFIHPYDCKQMKCVHETAMTKSQAISRYYRFFTQNGGWIWIQSSCIVIASNKADHGKCILFINNVLSERQYPDSIFAAEQVAAQEDKECSPSKRCRITLKSRKKMTRHILYNSRKSNEKLNNVSPNQTTEFPDLVEMTSYESENTDNTSPTSGFIRKSNLYESPEVANSHELNKDKCATIISDPLYNEYANISCLEPVINTINMRQDAVIHTNQNIMNNLTQELDDAGIVFQNRIFESSRAPFIFNDFTTVNNPEAFYTNLINANCSDLENYTYLDHYNLITSGSENQILWPKHGNLSTPSPINFFTNPLSNSSQDLIMNSDNSYSKSKVLDTEEDGEFVIDSCKSPLSKINKIVDLNQTNIQSPSSFSDIINYSNISDTNQCMSRACDCLSKEKHLFSNGSINMSDVNYIEQCVNTSGIPNFHERYQVEDLLNSSEILQEEISNNFSEMACNFHSSSNHQTNSIVRMEDDKYQFYTLPINNNDAHKKILLKRQPDPLLSSSVNPAKDDYDLNGKIIPDNSRAPIAISTAEKSPVTNSNNIFYLLSSLYCNTVSSDDQTATKKSILATSIKDSTISSETESPSTSDCKNEFSTTVTINPSYGFDFDSTIYHQSRNSPISHNSSIENTLVRSKHSSYEYSTFSNEYLSLLNDQWLSMYSQSATTARSDSASSSSLGYASGSSCVDQSSPFSTTGESLS